MKDRKKLLLYLMACLMVSLNGCNDNDAYYERPSWLEPPLYEVLKQKGNFSLFIEAIDRTLYKPVLNGSGSYTVLAPNDAAMKKFLSDKGYASVADVPVDELQSIIGYAMVYNKCDSASLGSLTGSNPSASSEVIPVRSFRKMTANYKTLYHEVINGQERWVADGYTDISGVTAYNKYIPILTNDYFRASGLTAKDYNAFYPDGTFTGLNVQSSQIVKANLFGENGVAHAVDKVNLPPLNMDEMLKNEKYSGFQSYLDMNVAGSYVFKDYVNAPLTTEYYKLLYPDKNIDNVIFKSYKQGVFNMNWETIAPSGTDKEANCYSIFIPSNAAVEEFTAELLRRTKETSIENIDPDILQYFLRAHFVEDATWPSQYISAMNQNSEYVNGGGALFGKDYDSDGILAAHMCSNGMLFEIDHVIQSGYFRSVYSEIFLNPEYNLTKLALDLWYNSLINSYLLSPLKGYGQENYTVLVAKDSLYTDDGYAYDDINNSFSNGLAAGGEGYTVNSRFQRLLKMQSFSRIKNNEVNNEIADFRGGMPEYDGYGFAVNDYGDMIRYKDNKLEAYGNIQDGTVVTVTELTDVDYNNGRVFAMDKLLQYGPRQSRPNEQVGWEDMRMTELLNKYFADNPQCSEFKRYLNIFLPNDESTGCPAGINKSGFYTVIIPTNDAVQKLLDEGLIPKITGSVGATYPPADQTKATNFLNSSFLFGMVIADDGMSRINPGNYEKYTISPATRITDQSWDLVAAKPTLLVTKENGQLVFTPQPIVEGLSTMVDGIGQARIIRGFNKSNYIGPRTVIHCVDQALTYKVNPKN